MRAADGWVPEDTFGARLALIRQRNGWNTIEAARVCGLNDQSWRNWEAGTMPRNEQRTAAKIAKASGASYTWLLTGGPLEAQNWKKVSRSGLHVLPGGNEGGDGRAWATSTR